MIWYCQKFYFPQIRCTCTIIASFKPIPILVPFGHTTYFSSFLPFLCILIHSLMFTLVTRESVSKVGSRRQTGFCVCSGLFLQNSPLSLRFQIGVLRRRGASGPEPAQPRSARARIPPFRYESLLFSSSSTFYRLGAFISDDDSLSLRIHAPRCSL